jgi:hypothetical protein
MPALERRSPASLSVATSNRSCSIRIGSLSGNGEGNGNVFSGKVSLGRG